MDNAFIANTGCEANEAAIKLARKWGNDKGIENPIIITMDKSFHGRTMATLSASGNSKIQAGFAPLLSGFVQVPFNDLAAIDALAGQHANIVAILVEPIQGEGGIHVPDADYLQGIRARCDQYGWLMMLDEIQTGIGRTGTWFAHQHANIVPDVMTLAKGLGSGVPVGACLAKGAAAEVFQAGNHGSTFGGNPLACRAALTTLAVMHDENLLAHAEKLGARIRAQFAQQLLGVTEVVDIRGQGLMIGIEMSKPCGALVGLAREAGLLINVTADKVIRLVPPLVLTDADADYLVTTLVAVIGSWLANSSL